MNAKTLESPTLSAIEGRRSIYDWQPWLYSTGAKTAKGKAKSSQNARMTPDKKRWRRLCRLLGYDYKKTTRIHRRIDRVQASMIFGSKHGVHGGMLTAVRRRNFRISKLEVETSQTYFANSNGDRLPDNPFLGDDEKLMRVLDVSGQGRNMLCING
jgi:hypothetical protein